MTHLGGFFIKRRLDSSVGKDVLYRTCLHEVRERPSSCIEAVSVDNWHYPPPPPYTHPLSHAVHAAGAAGRGEHGVLFGGLSVAQWEAVLTQGWPAVSGGGCCEGRSDM